MKLSILALFVMGVGLGLTSELKADSADDILATNIGRSGSALPSGLPSNAAGSSCLIHSPVDAQLGAFDTEGALTSLNTPAVPAASAGGVE